MHRATKLSIIVIVVGVVFVVVVVIIIIIIIISYCLKFVRLQFSSVPLSSSMHSGRKKKAYVCDLYHPISQKFPQRCL